ncbi:MAG: hypothetical protein ACR2OV_02190 [Hyphomicrobiaceae bacterium]
MSSSSKRVLPTSSTAALVPLPETAFNDRAHGRSNPNDQLIDQLVGGLMRADHPGDGSSRFSNQHTDFGASERTYSIDDEEIDEPPVPIPSTWRDPPNHAEPNWFIEQARASAYGFAVGLFVVIPAVLLLTGQAERLPTWQALVSYAQTSGNEASIADQSGYGEVAPTDTASKTTAQDQGTSPVAEPPAADTLTQAPAATAVASSTVPIELPGSSTTPRDSSPAATAEAPNTETLNQPATATVAPEREETVTTTNAESAPAPESTAASDGRAEIAPTVRDEPPPAAPKATIVASAPIETTPTNIEIPAQTPAPVTTSPPVVQPEATNSPKPVAEPATETQIAAVTTPDQNQAGSSGNATASPLTLEKPVTLAMARKTIKAGDMDSARVMLAKLASQGNTDAIFALAETFDPNVLAAWGTHGEEADSEKARMFYSMALAQGVDRAAGRLQALQE